MKRIYILIACIFVTLGMCGCTTSQDLSETNGNNSPFITVYKGSDVWIFVDKETDVEYVVVNNGHGGTEFQPLYNTDGTLKLYEGDK